GAVGVLDVQVVADGYGVPGGSRAVGRLGRGGTGGEGGYLRHGSSFGLRLRVVRGGSRGGARARRGGWGGRRGGGGGRPGAPGGGGEVGGRVDLPGAAPAEVGADTLQGGGGPVEGGEDLVDVAANGGDLRDRGQIAGRAGQVDAAAGAGRRPHHQVWVGRLRVG